MKQLTWIVVLASAAAESGRAHAATETPSTGTLTASDFTLTLARVDDAGAATLLASDELKTYFSAARCACPTSVLGGLTFSDTAAATLGTRTLCRNLNTLSVEALTSPATASRLPAPCPPRL